MNLDKFIISKSASLREALLRIEANHHGLIFIVEPDESVSAVATDGDIRRWLLGGGSLNDEISKCANSSFVFESLTTPREQVLKKLDNQIRVIPLLDGFRKLVGIASRDHLPSQVEGPVFARARAPVRISFGGGGSDLTYYFSRKSGAVINTTISLYSHSTLRIRDDERVIIHSLDLGETLDAQDLKSAISIPGRFGLIQALLKAISPDFGFELFLHSDFPMGSGLGGSAVLSASILGCFNQFRRDRWGLHELAEIAYQAERHYLGIAGGWQDQYATIFGGFNFMEFRMDQNIVHPLRIHTDTLSELEECLILCYTGSAHDSDDIHQNQRHKMREAHQQDMMEANVGLSYEMRNHLLRGRLLDFGYSLDKTWQLKRQFSEKISTFRIDQIYAGAKSNGAIGGKLLGAGAGGFFLFYTPPYQKHQLIKYLSNSGLKITPFRFEQEGLQSWTVRDFNNYDECVM